MRSAQKREGGVKRYPKFADQQYMICGQRGREGQQSIKSVDVIYGSHPFPLSLSLSLCLSSLRSPQLDASLQMGEDAGNVATD